MDLSIIIVSWQVKEKLRKNLQALFASFGVDFEVWVVDNNSQDGTIKMIKNEFPQVRLIANKQNLGFGKANNQALRRVKSPYVLLLNPDMRVKPDTLAKMLTWAKANPLATVASCYLLDENGQTIKQVRRFPRLWDQLAIILKLPHFFPHLLDSYILADFDYSRAQAVDSVRGSFMLINFTAVKKIARHYQGTLPYFDERYFLWFEEVDYCYQIKQAGAEVWYTPAAQCYDSVGQSFKQLPRGRAQRIFRASQLAFFEKWRPKWQYWLLSLAWLIGLGLAWLGEKIGLQTKGET